MTNNNVSPTPTTPSSNNYNSTTYNTMTSAVKSATPDIVIFNDAEVENNADLMVDLLFENIGGQELLLIARQDTVNGLDVLYSPIKNLNIIREEYNPNNILKLQKTSDKIFQNFPIDIDDTIPDTPIDSPDPEVTGNVYLDAEDNLVIELINIDGGEQVEVEVIRSGTIYSINLADNG